MVRDRLEMVQDRLEMVQDRSEMIQDRSEMVRDRSEMVQDRAETDLEVFALPPRTNDWRNREAVLHLPAKHRQSTGDTKPGTKILT